MSWDYSEPLNGALLAAANNNSSDLSSGLGGLGNLNSINNSTSLYNNYYSTGYDPLISRYKARASYYNRPSDSINLFDDLDDLALEVETNNLLSSRYKPSNKVALAGSYVPSYYDINKTSFNENEPFRSDNSNNNTNNKNFNQIPQRPPADYKTINKNKQALMQQQKQLQQQKQQQQQQPKKFNATKPNANNLQPRLNQLNNNNNNNNNPNTNNNNNSTPNLFNQKFQPMPFNPNNQNLNNNSNNNNNVTLIQAHNSQQQRFIQYQQRMQQNPPHQQIQLQKSPQHHQMNKNDSNLSELEILKMKQQQERQQLLAAIANNSNNNNNHSWANNDENYNNNNTYQNGLKPYKQYSETSIPSTNADPLNSNSPTPPMMSNRHRNPFEKNTFNKALINNNQKNNNFILNKRDDQDDPGSYLNTLRDARQREQRVAKDKYTSNDYKQYQKNFGFGRDFLPFEAETKRDKLEKARKREEYSKMIKERNTFLNENYTNHGKFTHNYSNGNNAISDPFSKNKQTAAAASNQHHDFSNNQKRKVKL